MILGIRCSTKDFSYVILDGNQESPKLIHSDTLPFPKGYTNAECLKWFYLEIGGIIKTHGVSGIGIKGIEPMAMRGKSYGARMEKEGMVFLQAVENGIKNISRKVKSTIAKDLGFKGKGKYLKTKADFSSIDGYSVSITKVQEAIQVATSMLD